MAVVQVRIDAGEVRCRGATRYELMQVLNLDFLAMDPARVDRDFGSARTLSPAV